MTSKATSFTGSKPVYSNVWGDKFDCTCAVKTLSCYIVFFCFRIRIYFNQGEAVYVKPLSGEMEETREICDRLIGVTSGCEVSVWLIIKCLVFLTKGTRKLLYLAI